MYFSSIFVLDGSYATQIDDLISTMYSILFLLEPDSVPWAYVFEQTQFKLDDIKKIRETKMILSSDKF